MLERLLPRRIDNDYRGQRVALWLFAVVLVVKTGIALSTIFNGRVAAGAGDGIPLASFGTAAADTVLALFAIWGVAYLVVSAIGVLALVRYRAMVPLMFLLLTLEYLTKKVVLVVLPIARSGPAPGAPINAALLGLMIAGLALSLWPRKGTAVGARRKLTISAR